MNFNGEVQMNLETEQEQNGAIFATIKRHELRCPSVHCEKVKRQKHTERIRELNALKNLVRGRMRQNTQ